MTGGVRVALAMLARRAVAAAGAVIVMTAGAASDQNTGPVRPGPDPVFETVSFQDLSRWADDDHAAALAAFVRFCAPGLVTDQRFLQLPDDVCEAASALAEANSGDTTSGGDAAKAFFEQNFTPHRFKQAGFVTGYFEPELAAARAPNNQHRYPLLRPPGGLVAVTDANRPHNWPAELSHGRMTEDGLVPLPDRGAIMDGALRPENLELVWLRDPVDAFFVHVQGSARLRLEDGSVMRVGYAGKTGHPYTSIARVLVDRGEGRPEDLTMSGLRRWLVKNPAGRDALFRENRSHIFFREVTGARQHDGPIGSAGVPLVAGRSLAVDPAFVPFALPAFVAGQDLADLDAPDREFSRLMMADDSGSAIKGAGRADIFVGSGVAAGSIAGEIRHTATLTVLVPRGLEDAFAERMRGAE